MTSGARPGRRAFLLGAVATTAGLVAACTSRSGPHPSPTPAPPSPDELAAGRAVRAARTLLGGESTVTGGSSRVTTLLTDLTAAHREHLTALGLPAPSPGADPSGAVSPTDSATGATGPGGSGDSAPSGSPSPTRAAPATLAAAEWAAAREAFGDVAITTPVTAGLLARIAAARAVHADLLRGAAGLAPSGELTALGAAPTSSAASAGSSPGTTAAGAPAPGETPSGDTPSGTGPGPGSAPGDGAASPTTSPTDLDGAAAEALSALLAGEHAAVFAYGLIVARASGTRERRARTLWQAHRQRRDELERRLVSAGRTPPVTEPAYDVGTAPTTAAQLAALAARVEDGLAAVAFGAVTRTSGAVRTEVAGDLVRGARRAAAWRGRPVALPGGATP